MTKEIKEHCRRCPRCTEPLKTVFVHGHEQCVNCDQVIYDCCQGETSCTTVEAAFLSDNS